MKGFMLVLLMIFSTWSTDNKYVQPKTKLLLYKEYNDTTQTGVIYQNERLLVIIDKGKQYKIKKDSLTGWIFKKDVVRVTGKKMDFNDITVNGFDNATPMFIIDANDCSHVEISLKRSFFDVLENNTDREVVERFTK